MSYYGDLLREYEKRYTKGFYGGLPVYLRIKSNPSANASLSQTYRVSRKVEDKQESTTT
jgi:hypothetical protein